MPIQGANSYAPFKTLLKCPCLKQRQLLPLRGHTALLLTGDGSAGSSPNALHRARHVAVPKEHWLMFTLGAREEPGLGHLLHILFLILPFLEGAPRPKAPCCSSRAWRRLRAESCLRPPRCRKRIFWAWRLCFRICCLVLSSERTRPAGGPEVRGWEAPAKTRIQGAQPPDCSPAPTPIVHCCGPSLWHIVGASQGLSSLQYRSGTSSQDFRGSNPSCGL